MHHRVVWLSVVAVLSAACVVKRSADTPSKVAAGVSLGGLVNQNAHLVERGSRSVSTSSGYERTLGLYEREELSTVKIPAGGEEAFWQGMEASVAAAIDSSGQRRGQARCGGEDGIRCRSYAYECGGQSGKIYLWGASAPDNEVHLILLAVERSM